MTSRIIECESLNSFKNFLKKDSHNVPFKRIGERTGPLKNKNAKESETTNLMRKIVEERGCHKSIIETYDHFLLHKIPKRIEATTMMIGNNIMVKFSDIEIMRPCKTKYQVKSTLTPLMARNLHQSYMSKVFVNVNQYDVRTNELVMTERVEIAEVPVMLGSVACHTYGLTDGERYQMGEGPNDTFGYFINNGVEKVFKSKETLRYNIPATYKEAVGYETRFTCVSATNIGTTLFIMRCPTDGKDDDGLFVVRLQHFEDNKFVDVFTLFRALGWDSEKALEVIVGFANIDIKKKLKIEQKLRETTAFSKNITDDNIIPYIESLRKERFKAENDNEIIDDLYSDLFSNVTSNDKKLYTLAFITAHTAMTVMGYVVEDDRNSWSNKKLQVAANTVESSFNSSWSTRIKKIEETINKSHKNYNVQEISHNFNSADFRKKILEVFSTKVKNVGGKGGDKKPLTEQYKRNTPIDGTSLITKTTASTSSQSKKAETRIINGSQYLVACPAETPESEYIGIVKNLAITCHIALSVDGPSLAMIEDLLGKLDDNPSESTKPLFVNGKLYGFLNKDKYQDLRRMKADGYLPYDACVHDNVIQGSYEVFTVESRPTVPLLVVKEGRLVIDEKQMWQASIDELIKEEALEYLDVREVEYLKVSESVDQVRNEKRIGRYTHSSIQTNAMFSIGASLSPWANKNKGPRVIYQASMVKQSQCAFSLVHHLIFLSSFKVLNYATRPICESNMLRSIGMESMPNTQNIIVAVLTRPNNNEDAVEVKKEMLHGQLFRISKYTGIKVVAENSKNLDEIFAKPTITSKDQARHYAHLNQNGLPSIGAYINRDDILVGKLKSNSGGEIKYNAFLDDYETGFGNRPVNVSKRAGVDEDGFVDRILVTNTANNETIVRVKIMQYRHYEAGDKYAFRYSQKGTIGQVTPSAKLPRIKGGPYDGVVPDVFFSPLSLPSRMTAAMPIEIDKGNAFVYTGDVVDCTTFEKDDINESSNILRKSGKELYGMSGDELDRFSKGLFHMEREDGKIMGEHRLQSDGSIKFFPTEVSIGPIAYQPLKHHVADKFQVRRKGPINILTRQGVSGRSRLGALRFGEMEKDAFASAGAANSLLERMKNVADEYKYFICSCGEDAIAVAHLKSAVCSYDPSHGKNGDKHKFGVISITYISLLIKRLLAIASIKLRYIPRRDW